MDSPTRWTIRRTGHCACEAFGAVQEWDDNDAGAERNTGGQAKEGEIDLEEEDGVQRRRKALKRDGDLLMVCCPQGQELQPEKKKQNRCNHCGCTGTAFRSRESDYDLCEPCHKNLSRRVPVRFQEGDRLVIKGSGYTRRDGLDWRFCRLEAASRARHRASNG